MKRASIYVVDGLRSDVSYYWRCCTGKLGMLRLLGEHGANQIRPDPNDQDMLVSLGMKLQIYFPERFGNHIISKTKQDLILGGFAACW